MSKSDPVYRTFYCVAEPMSDGEPLRMLSAEGIVTGSQVRFTRGLAGYVMVHKSRLAELLVASSPHEAAKLYLDKQEGEVKRLNDGLFKAKERLYLAAELQASVMEVHEGGEDV